MKKIGGFLKHHHHHDKHDKHDKVSGEEYEKLRVENEELKEKIEEVEGNLELAKATERFNANHLKRLPELESEVQTYRDELEARIQSQHESASSHDEALIEGQSKFSELEAQMAATEERHKAMQKRLAAEVTSKDSAANDAKAKLIQAEKALAALREETAESASSGLIDAHQEVSELRAALKSTEEEEQLLRSAAVKHDEAMKELRDALREAKEGVAETSQEAGVADSSIVATLRSEIAQLETNAAQEQESMRLQMLTNRTIEPTTELHVSTSEVAHVDKGDDQVEHLESQISELKSEVSRSEALVVMLQNRLQLAEVLASASPRALDGQEDDSSLRTCVPADVGGSAEREVSAHYDELRREVEDLRDKLQHTKDESSENEIGLQEARDSNATLQSRLIALEAQVAESSEAATSHNVVQAAAESGRSEAHVTERSIETSGEEESHGMEIFVAAFQRGGSIAILKVSLENLPKGAAALQVRLEALESEVVDLTKSLSEKSSVTDDRFAELQARQNEAEDALERSEAQRTSQQLALVDAQCECDTMREELAEKSELVSNLIESSESAEQVNERASNLVLELTEVKLTCDGLEETCESVKQEMVSKEEAMNASEELQGKLREELQEAEEAISGTTAALKEELARENSEHEAAVAIGQEKSSENMLLQQEVAKLENSETLMRELRAELAQAQASSPEVQAELDENAPAVQALRMELLQEKRRYADAQLDRVTNQDGLDILKQELDEAGMTVANAQVMMAMADDEDDDQAEKIKDLQHQCLQLKSELRSANARADLRAADEAIREQQESMSRLPRPTADFGMRNTMSLGDSSPTRKNGGNRVTFAKLDLDGNDTMLSDSAAFDEPSQDFNPPSRINSSSGLQKAISFSDNRVDDDILNDTHDTLNPFKGDLCKDGFTKLNPFEESTLESEEGNPSALSDSHQSSQLATSPHKLSDDVVPREEYQLEVQACRRAREEAHQYSQKQNGADSDIARELQRAQRALADEEAKSRRLCEHALRAEQSRKSLYHEILEDYKTPDKETDLLKLAQLVGRAAKAISAVSAVAPRLAPAVFPSAQDARAETASAGVSRTPASARPVHQETLAGIQGAPGRPPRSPRLQGNDEPRGRQQPSRATAMPYSSPRQLETPSFEKHPRFEDLMASDSDPHTVRPDEIASFNDDLR